VIESSKYGKMLVDLGGTVPLTGKAARFLDYEGYLNWKQKNNFFMVTGDTDLDLELGDGVRVRNMWIKKDGLPIKIGLRDIVNEQVKDGGRVGVGVLEYMEENEKNEIPKEQNKFEADAKVEVLRNDILTMLSTLKEPVDVNKIQYLKENLPTYSDDKVKTLNTIIDMYLHPEKRKLGLYLWNNKAEPILRFLGLKVV
jgi:hypothetical protein